MHVILVGVTRSDTWFLNAYMASNKNPAQLAN